MMTLRLGTGVSKGWISILKSVSGVESVVGTERLKEVPSRFSLAKRFDRLEDELRRKILVELVEFSPVNDSWPGVRLFIEILPITTLSQRSTNWTLLNLLVSIMSLMPRYKPQTRNLVSIVPSLLVVRGAISTRGT